MADRWRIRSHLVMLVLAVAVPVTGLLAYTIYTHRQQALSDAAEMALALAQIATINTRNYVQNRLDVLARLAERPLMRALNSERCDPVLKDFRDFDAGFSNVVVINRDGLVICSALPLDGHLSDGDNFKLIMQDENLAVGTPNLGQISKTWILPLAYPIRDDQGEVNGLIGAAIDLVQYTPLLGISALPSGTTITLLNAKGVVLAHSHNPELWVGKQVQDNALSRTVLEQGTGRVRMAGLEGEDMVLGFSTMSGSGWYAVVGIPTSVILAEAHNITLYQSGLLLVILAAAAMLAFLIAQRIELPIRSIAAAAKQVATGDLKSRLSTTGPAEIAVVATEFNQMLDRRQQAEQRLRETAEHLRLAMDAARMGNWEWNIVQDRISCSDSTGPLFGLPPGATFENYEHFLACIHPDDHSTVQNSIKQTTLNELPFACEYRVIWPDGSEHWLAARGRLLSDAAGRPERILGICMDITERMQSDQQMRYLANHDPLTELVNRREFENRLNTVLSRARSQNCQNAVLYLDLDQFKIVNDTCGHFAGDELLRQLASLLAEKIRESDTLARLGGDEFVVLLENCPLDDAHRLAEELRETVLDFNFAWRNKSFKVGVSIGLVPITDDQLSLEQILSAADAACFIAKDQGRNRVHIHHTQDSALVQHRGQMEWVTRIHAAYSESRFRIYCQAIAPLAATTKPHWELLIRMQGAEGELIPPMAFIPAAERYGLMPNLDRWIIETAFKVLEKQSDPESAGGICNINLSATSLNNNEFLTFIHEQFYCYKVAPQSICFEITETSAIANLPHAMRFISALKQIGCRIALDDFGSGMSSFTYLKNLAVDYLKIDGSFVCDMVHDPIDRAMVEAINKIGHVMGIRTIAECVENVDILEQVQRLGIDFAQGCYIAKPVPLEDFIKDAVAIDNLPRTAVAASRIEY